MIRNIIFDFGSVLVDWDRRHYYDKYFGEDREREDYFLNNICTLEWNSNFDAGKDMKEGCEKLAAEHPEWREAILGYWEHWTEMVGGEIPGMRKLILDLKGAGMPVYGLTNWSAQTIPWVYENCDIIGLMDHTVCSGYEKIIKPEPAIFKLLLDRYGLVADECLFIDDNPANIKTAEDLGIHTHLFSEEPVLRRYLESLGIL